MDKKEELLIKIHDCESKIEVGDATDIFVQCIAGLEKRVDGVKRIKSKIEQGEWNALINSISLTFLGALYINCDIPDEEKKKRALEFADAFADTVKGVSIARKEPKKANGEA